MGSLYTLGPILTYLSIQNILHLKSQLYSRLFWKYLRVMNCILLRAISSSLKYAYIISFQNFIIISSCFLSQETGEGASPTYSSKKKQSNIFVKSQTFQARNSLSTSIRMLSNSYVISLKMKRISRKLVKLNPLSSSISDEKKAVLLAKGRFLSVSVTIHSFKAKFITLLLKTSQTNVTFKNMQSKNYYSFSSRSWIDSLFMKKVRFTFKLDEPVSAYSSSLDTLDCDLRARVVLRRRLGYLRLQPRLVSLIILPMGISVSRTFLIILLQVVSLTLVSLTQLVSLRKLASLGFKELRLPTPKLLVSNFLSFRLTICIIFFFQS